MESLYERLVNACIEMNAGEVITLDDDVLVELRRRKLIRKVQQSDCIDEGCDYVISGIGQRLAERVMSAREIMG